MNAYRLSSIRRRLLMFVCASTLHLACSSSDSEVASTDTNTNWLKLCDEDADCGDELSCLCGVCSTTCSESAQCLENWSGSECRVPDEDACGQSPPVGLCTEPDTELPGSSSSSSSASDASPDASPGSDTPGNVTPADGGGMSVPGSDTQPAVDAAPTDPDLDAGTSPGDSGPVDPTPTDGGSADPTDAGVGAAEECAAPLGNDYPATEFTPPEGCLLNDFGVFGNQLITDETGFAQAFFCADGVTSGIDFVTQQLYLAVASERTESELSYVHINDVDDVVVGLRSPVYCGGAAPPNTTVPVLMDRTLRAPSTQLCTFGMCEGPPLP